MNNIVFKICSCCSEPMSWISVFCETTAYLSCQHSSNISTHIFICCILVTHFTAFRITSRIALELWKSDLPLLCLKTWNLFQMRRTKVSFKFLNLFSNWNGLEFNRSKLILVIQTCHLFKSRISSFQTGHYCNRIFYLGELLSI